MSSKVILHGKKKKIGSKLVKKPKCDRIWGCELKGEGLCVAQLILSATPLKPVELHTVQAGIIFVVQ